MALLAVAAPASSHVGDADGMPPTLATAVTADPWLVGPLLAAAVLYGAGLWRLWARAGIGAGIRIPQAAAFAVGYGLLLLALVWPLDAYGEWSLAVHMAQHMILIAAAAPLLVTGLPGAVWLAALPARAARRWARPFRSGPARRAWRTLTDPAGAMAVQALVMWAWHAPAAMERALRSDPWHYAMHASFLAVGLLFWSALFRALREPVAGFTAGIVAIVGTMVQMGLLGALLTFADSPRFPFYAERTPALGLTPLQDQQLAGLIMWVPGAVPYLVGGLALTAVWLRRSAHVH